MEQKKNWGFNKGERRRSGIDGRRALMRTYSRRRRDKHMRGRGSKVGSVCPNWLTKLLK